jgi:hypothetical protein
LTLGMILINYLYFIYSGCQKNMPAIKRFFTTVHALMLQFHHWV